MNRRERRAAILFDHGAAVDVADELLAYTPPLPKQTITNAVQAMHRPPGLLVNDWLSITTAEEAIFTALQERFIQLRFPIREGISQERVYQSAARRGIVDHLPSIEEGLRLQHPEQLRIMVHDSLVGPVPVILPYGRIDFEMIVQALGQKNEPVPVPEAMGAAIISGLINWNRLRQMRVDWLVGREDHPFAEALWRQELVQHILPHRQLYQETFIILGDSFYSNISPESLNLTEAVWRAYSQTIRLGHESTHFVMRQLGVARPNHMLDELVADFQGSVQATGRFQADWFLHFMGLENYPGCRETGRLALYRGTPPLSEPAFVLLQGLLWHAAHHLERFFDQHHVRFETAQARLSLLLALSTLSLEELASVEAEDLIERSLTVVGAVDGWLLESV